MSVAKRDSHFVAPAASTGEPRVEHGASCAEEQARDCRQHEIAGHRRCLGALTGFLEHLIFNPRSRALRRNGHISRGRTGRHAICAGPLLTVRDCWIRDSLDIPVAGQKTSPDIPISSPQCANQGLILRRVWRHFKSALVVWLLSVGTLLVGAVRSGKAAADVNSPDVR